MNFLYYSVVTLIFQPRVELFPLYVADGADRGEGEGITAEAWFG